MNGGHHRFVAAKLTNTKIPGGAIHTTKLNKPSPGGRSWDNATWFKTK